MRQVSCSRTWKASSVLVAIFVALAVTACTYTPEPPCLLGRERGLTGAPVLLKWPAFDFEVTSISGPGMRDIEEHPRAPCETGMYMVTEEYVELKPGEVLVRYAYKSQGWSPMKAVRYTHDEIWFTAVAGGKYLVESTGCSVSITDEATGTQKARKRKDYWYCG